jgi:serine/threonine protein kinase
MIKHFGIFERNYLSDERYLVLEYFPKGSLDVYLKQKPRTKEEKLIMSLQLLSALRYLEVNKIVFRDLAAFNIFVAVVDNTMQIKLGDMTSSILNAPKLFDTQSSRDQVYFRYCEFI